MPIDPVEQAITQAALRQHEMSAGTSGSSSLIPSHYITGSASQRARQDELWHGIISSDSPSGKYNDYIAQRDYDYELALLLNQFGLSQSSADKAMKWSAEQALKDRESSTCPALNNDKHHAGYQDGN